MLLVLTVTSKDAVLVSFLFSEIPISGQLLFGCTKTSTEFLCCLPELTCFVFEYSTFVCFLSVLVWMPPCGFHLVVPTSTACYAET